jgi:DNA adenine methylase
LGQVSDSLAAAPVRPPLKWAGGKRWLLPLLRLLWTGETRRRLVEPFCGGLAVTLGLRPQSALLNDLNPHVINLYRWLKRGLPCPTGMVNDAARYYEARTRFNELLTSRGARTAEAAGLFYYLNRTGYNGLCRFNRRGLFNVPFGRYRTVPYEMDFLRYRRVFSRWLFTSTDFEALPLRPDDIVYADPPYDVPFTQYSATPFGWPEQERTAAWLSRHAGPVILSNQATPRIVSLYRELAYTVTFLPAPRRISCTGDRTPALEVLATRNLDIDPDRLSGVLRKNRVS